MVTSAVEHALVFKVAQIIDGDPDCAACGNEACLMVANGADPDYEPVCLAHALEWLIFTQHTLERLFGTKGG